MFQAASKVNGQILWANMHLLFWLSLIPFASGWMGENGFSTLPVALYGVILLMSGFAYNILTRVLVSHHGKDSLLEKALGKDFKGKLSFVINCLSVLFAFVNPWISMLCYVSVAIMWLVPDKRIEKHL